MCHSSISSPSSKDSCNECKDSSSVTYSLISSDEMGIFSEDIESETEEVAVTSYQFEPADAYSSDSDEPSEDECASSDEEKLPDDMSWYKDLIIILFLCLMI